MAVPSRVAAVYGSALGVATLLLLAFGPAQEPDAPAASAPTGEPGVEYLAPIVEGEAVQLTHEVIRNHVTTEVWTQWVWLEDGVPKWVSVSRVAIPEGAHHPVLQVQIDNGVTRTTVIRPGTRYAKMLLMPSAGSTRAFKWHLPIWACEPGWLRHWYRMYPWAWAGDIRGNTWLGVRVDTLGLGPAPLEGDDPWQKAGRLLHYEPGTANLVGVDEPGWKETTTWRAAVVDTRPSIRPEDYVERTEWDALPRIDNRDVCPAYFDRFGPQPMEPDLGALEWLRTFRDKARGVLRQDPTGLGAFVPGLIDRPSGAPSDELQTLQWQELNTGLFVTLSDEQLAELASSRGVILGEAASLSDEQRDLLARIWDIPEFVTDPGCERVQWCCTAFAYGGADNLVVIRRAPALIRTGWLAYRGFQHEPPP